jgi:hypothetical protein
MKLLVVSDTKLPRPTQTETEMDRAKLAACTGTLSTPKTLTVPDAGWVYFGLSRPAAYAAAKRGDFPTIRIGRRLMVPVKALEAMLDAAAKQREVA